MSHWKFDDFDDDEEYKPKNRKDKHNYSYSKAKNTYKAKHIKTYKLRSLNNNSNYNSNNNLHLDTVINKYSNKYLNNNIIKNTNKYINETEIAIKVIKPIQNKRKYSPEAEAFTTLLTVNQPQLTKDALKEHITYFNELPTEKRTVILSHLKDINELSTNIEPHAFKIINSSLDTYYKKLALNKLQNLQTMEKTDNEYFKLSQWLDNFLDIPFNKYQTPKYLDNTVLEKPSEYIANSRKHLDTVIYGQEETKQHIIEILARMITNPKTLGSVFAIHGEAGTGKTTLIKEGLSQVFGLPFVFISLGGAQDRTFLAGSNYVYEGSACGKIIQSLKQAKCMNPIFYFDELDKVSQTEKGQEIMNLLIHLTDYTQNSHFLDDYMDGITVDLSRATFIFSFNDKNLISPILLDRMELIRFKSYSSAQKIHIAREYLLPNVVKNCAGDSLSIKISDKSFEKIVGFDLKKNTVGSTGSVSSAGSNGSVGIGLNNKSRCILKRKQKIIGGVRYIKKRLEKIVSRINLEILTGAFIINKNNNEIVNEIIIDDDKVNSILDIK
jgi:ATP-dependent Lon protease